MSNESSASALSSAFAAANRGPLTRIFTPPGSCLTETTVLSFLSALPSPSNGSVTSTAVFINHHTWGDAACYPSTILTSDGFTKWNNNYYYSPGICPSGWTSACQQKTNPAGFTTSQSPETTAILCCPSNWSCVTGSSTNNHACTTILYAGQTLTSVWIPTPTPTPNVPLNITTNRKYTTWDVATETTAVCDGIPILWQSTDLAILALLSPITSSASTSGTTTSTQATSTIQPSSTTRSPTSTSTATVDTSTLSPGAKAAIGVLIPLVFLALLTGIFFYMRHSKRHKDEAAMHHELPATGQRHELDQKSWNEADPDNAVVPELGGRENRTSGVYELAGGGLGVAELPGEAVVLAKKG